jgi:hypothetical protein
MVYKPVMRRPLHPNAVILRPVKGLRKVSAALLLAAITAMTPLTAQTVEAWQKAAMQKHPALAQAGSPLNQRFLALVAEKRKSDPAFFANANWPVRAADGAPQPCKPKNKQ